MSITTLPLSPLLAVVVSQLTTNNGTTPAHNMAPQYKLTYFPVQALAEPIRYLLSYGNIEFEDHRINNADWEDKIKPTMPFGRLPILQFDGKTFHQHTAICRYLARKLKLTGKDDVEAAEIDQLVDTLSDVRGPLASFHYEKDQAKKAALLEPMQKEIVPYYFSRFEIIVSDNNGYLVGKQLTWGDIYFAALWNCLKDMARVDLDKNYPNLSALVQKVNSLPQIKDWIAKRPPQY